MQESLINLTSLLVALVSLIISVVALLISKKAYVLTSKDYIPKIDYSININNLEIYHATGDLFAISSVNFIEVTKYGFENIKDEKLTQVPFITRSSSFSWLSKKGTEKKISIPFDTPASCAYLCPYDKEMVGKVSDKIFSDYTIDNPDAYASPSMQSLYYIIEVNYKNKFHEFESVIFKHEHFHGSGFEKFKISKEELNNLLNKANVPRFKEFDNLWNYIILNHTRGYEDFFGD
jgi:hypothetical protein